jgi:hypothetical protein
MFLPNDYLVYEYGKELLRAADNAALVRLVREDAPAPLTRWMNRLIAMFRRPQRAMSQPQTGSPNAKHQTAALKGA